MKYSNMLMKIGGALMIVIGILLYTDNMIWINIWYSNLTNLFENFRMLHYVSKIVKTANRVK
ncbi:hypothetical protein PO124_25415 [Bacillus licheniformis]|nr:hypothetical protein [Bacillus licheniformis]